MRVCVMVRMRFDKGDNRLLKLMCVWANVGGRAKSVMDGICML